MAQDSGHGACSPQVMGVSIHLIVPLAARLFVRALSLHVCGFALAACGAESVSEAPQGAGGTESSTGDSPLSPPPTGPDACVCNQGDRRYACSNGDTPIMDVADWCAASGDPCPATLEVWRSCSSRGLLSSPGRQGYLLAPCEGGLTQVHYVFGFGEHSYWLYDESGALVGRGITSDTSSGVTCGVPTDGCPYPFTAGGDVEALSPTPGDAGPADPAAPECAGL